MTKGADELFLQRREIHAKRFGPGQDYIIMRGAGGKRIDPAQGFLEATADPIAQGRAAELFGHGDAKAWSGVVLARLWLQSDLKDKALGVKAPAFGRRDELGPAGEPLWRPRALSAASVPAARRRLRRTEDAAQAESRLRPRARRAAITLRPPTVAMRARNPCRRLRTSLLG